MPERFRFSMNGQKLFDNNKNIFICVLSMGLEKHEAEYIMTKS